MGSRDEGWGRRLLARVLSTATVVVLTWLFLWPLGLGGQTSYVVVSGPSMEPTYHSGDLVVARSSDSYEVGDIVVYRTEYGDVIHRIVGGDADAGFVLQGDNNDSIDQWQPRDADILGEAVLHVPAVGSFALTAKAVLLTPPMPYLIAGFVFLVIVLGEDRQKPGPEPADGVLDRPAEPADEDDPTRALAAQR